MGVMAPWDRDDENHEMRSAGGAAIIIRFVLVATNDHGRVSVVVAPWVSFVVPCVCVCVQPSGVLPTSMPGCKRGCN